MLDDSGADALIQDAAALLEATLLLEALLAPGTICLGTGEPVPVERSQLAQFQRHILDKAVAALFDSNFVMNSVPRHDAIRLLGRVGFVPVTLSESGDEPACRPVFEKSSPVDFRFFHVIAKATYLELKSELLSCSIRSSDLQELESCVLSTLGYSVRAESIDEIRLALFREWQNVRASQSETTRRAAGLVSAAFTWLRERVTRKRK